MSYRDSCFIQLHVCVYRIYQIEIISWKSDRDSCFIQLYVCVYRIYQNRRIISWISDRDSWFIQLHVCVSRIYQNIRIISWISDRNSCFIQLHVWVYMSVFTGLSPRVFDRDIFELFNCMSCEGNLEINIEKKMKLACFCCKITLWNVGNLWKIGRFWSSMTWRGFRIWFRW